MIAGYELTAEDWLWLLRAVAAEGPSHIDVARALVNLWALARARGSKQPLAWLVRNYSQPVNPKWSEGGGFDSSPGVVSPAERRREQASVATEFSPAVASAVAAALTTPWESDVTDFARPDVDASAKGYVARSPVVRGRNRLWSRDTSWKGYTVGPMTNKERVAAIRSLARALPRGDRLVVERALDRLMTGVLVGWDGGLLDGVRVIRPGEPGYDEAKAKAMASPEEADLAVANQLDQMYGAVADRVKSLGGAAIDVVAKVSQPLGGFLWAAAAVGLVWWLNKK